MLIYETGIFQAGAGLGDRHPFEGNGFFGAAGDALCAGAVGLDVDWEGLLPTMRRAFEPSHET